MPETILLHGRDNERKDGEAAAAITPGELLEHAGTNGEGELQFQPHSETPDLNGNGSARPLFAREYSHTGRTIDDDYAAGEHMEYHDGLPGDEVYAFIDAGETVSPGDPLESAGNGALAVHTGVTTVGDGSGTANETVADDLVVGYAVEAVDNSGGTDPVRVRVEIA